MRCDGDLFKQNEFCIQNGLSFVDPNDVYQNTPYIFHGDQSASYPRRKDLSGASREGNKHIMGFGPFDRQN